MASKGKFQVIQGKAADAPAAKPEFQLTREDLIAFGRGGPSPRPPLSLSRAENLFKDSLQTSQILAHILDETRYFAHETAVSLGIVVDDIAFDSLIDRAKYRASYVASFAFNSWATSIEYEKLNIKVAGSHRLNSTFGEALSLEESFSKPIGKFLAAKLGEYVQVPDAEPTHAVSDGLAARFVISAYGKRFPFHIAISYLVIAAVARKVREGALIETEIVLGQVLKLCRAANFPLDKERISDKPISFPPAKQQDVIDQPPAVDLPKSLPEVAPAKWPQDKQGRESAVEFAVRVYRPWMDARLLAHVHLDQLDPKLYRAINQWMTHNQGDVPRKALPEGFYLLSKVDVSIAWAKRVKRGEITITTSSEARKFANLVSRYPDRLTDERER